jgi:hypothetical protein
MVAVRGCRPLVFFATGNVESGPGARLVITGAQAARFRPFNLLAPGRSVFWMGSNPFAFSVSAFAGLASSASAGHILARCSGLTHLLSTDPLHSSRAAAASSVAELSRPVACSCSLPLVDTAAQPARQLVVTLWDVGVQNGPALAEPVRIEIHVTEEGEEAGAAAARTMGSRVLAWPAPLAVQLFEDCAWLEVRLVGETRGKLLARGDLAPLSAASRDVPAAVRVELWDAAGVPAGFLVCSLRWSLAAGQPPSSVDPVLELLGRPPAARSAPPPVPQRPAKPPAADLITL